MNQVSGDPTNIANVRMPIPDHLKGDHSTVMSYTKYDTLCLIH
jgi:hypothetical protein